MEPQHKGVPEGGSAVIPRLVCRDVGAEIEFCCEALGTRGHRSSPPAGAERNGSSRDADVRACNAHVRSRVANVTESRSKLGRQLSGRHLPLCRRCGCHGKARLETGRQARPASRNALLGRSNRLGSGSCWAHVDDCNARRRDNRRSATRAMVKNFVAENRPKLNLI